MTVSKWGLEKPVGTISHNLGQIVSDLNARIQALETAKEQIETAIAGNVAVASNTAELEHLTQSLLAAQSAKLALQSSCCPGHSCQFNWED